MELAFKAYNNTPHKALNNLTPNEALKNPERTMQARREVQFRFVDNLPPASTFNFLPRYNIGDRVHVRLNKPLLGSKISDNTYSQDIYTIAHVINSVPLASYKLSTSDGFQLPHSYSESDLISAGGVK